MARPFVRGDGHLLITLPPSGVKWDEKSHQRLQLERQYDVDILCGHFLGYVQGSMDLNIYRQIGAEHPALFAVKWPFVSGLTTNSSIKSDASSAFPQTSLV